MYLKNWLKINIMSNDTSDIFDLAQNIDIIYKYSFLIHHKNVAYDFCYINQLHMETQIVF